jgi:hypothetical protein
MATTFSIILPLYKQESHAELLYKTYVEHLDSLKESWELLFIVNGVKDGAIDKLNNLNSRQNVKVLWLERGGWGRAVKYGMSQAEGKFLCYTNSARTEIEDLIMILKYAKVNDDNVVKATRIIREKIIRKVGSTLYNLECRLLYKVPIWDVNGTPKVIPKRIYDDLDITSDDDLIDAEIIIKCSKKKVRIIEIPVISTARISGSSTTNFGSAYRMYKGLLRFKENI